MPLALGQPSALLEFKSKDQLDPWLYIPQCCRPELSSRLLGPRRQSAWEKELFPLAATSRTRRNFIFCSQNMRYSKLVTHFSRSSSPQSHPRLPSAFVLPLQSFQAGTRLPHTEGLVAAGTHWGSHGTPSLAPQLLLASGGTSSPELSGVA